MRFGEMKHLKYIDTKNKQMYSKILPFFNKSKHICQGLATNQLSLFLEGISPSKSIEFGNIPTKKSES